MLSLRTLSLIPMLLISPSGGASRPPAKYELKIAIQAPENSSWGVTLKEMAAEVEKETGGEVKLKTYASGVQGDERTVLRKMRIGQLHGASLVGQGLTDICPDSLVLNLPLLFRSEDEADHVLEKIRPTLEKQCRDKGYEILAWPRLGFSYLFSKEKIRTVADLRESRPWLQESDPLSRNLYDAMRVTPVSTGFANVLTALQSGLIRTVFSPPAGLIAMQWHSRIKYRLDLKITYSFGVFLIAKKRWDRLPARHQETLRSVLTKRNDELNKTIREQNREALEVLTRHGIETVTVPPESLEEFTRTSATVGDKMAGENFSREILVQVKKLLKDYRDHPPGDDE